MDHRRFHFGHEHLGSPFGSDAFGRAAEAFARYFGTPRFIGLQTAVVVGWIVLNAVAFVGAWDPYPFILLNLVFSTQAAYAAPLILLAQTRQAERDKVWSDADARHREAISAQLLELLQQNTKLTEDVERLTREVHERVLRPPPG